MTKSKEITKSNIERELSEDKIINNNGYYTETIKSQKKSFVSRILVPVFICLLCLALSISACTLTLFYVRKINQLDTDFPFLNILTQTQNPSSTNIPVPSQTQGENNNSYSSNEENTESVITTYKNIYKVEIIPFEVNSSISDAVLNIMPSIAYIRCWYSEEQGTYMTEASALIISDDGYMITANSVVDNLCYEKSNELKEHSYIEVCVNYDYNNLYFAKVIGRDVINDVALLKIVPDDPLQFIEYGDSDKLILGETVIAAASGNNSSKGQVTAGIVSGLMYTFKDKIALSTDSLKDDLYMIKTTATMTSINNGGALVNKNGQVVALTVFSKEDNEEGFYKAIPINNIKEAAENLEVKSYNEDTLPNLGIAISSETVNFKIMADDLQQQIDVQGIKVNYIGYGTPAFYSGLKVNDIIVNIYDKSVSSPESFFDLKNTYLPGENLLLVVYRHNDQINEYMELQIIIAQD